MSSCGPPLGENCLLDSPIINRLGDVRGDTLGDTRRISERPEMSTDCCCCSGCPGFRCGDASG